MSETENDRKQLFAATSARLYHSLLAGADPCTAAMNPCLINSPARACNGGREIESLGRLGGPRAKMGCAAVLQPQQQAMLALGE
jgi:hypothetical protein